MLTLAEISPGQSALITHIVGDDTLSMRLLEMGVIDGERVEVIGRAPLGDPIEIAIRGYRLSLRKQEAERVAVIGDIDRDSGKALSDAT